MFFLLEEIAEAKLAFRRKEVREVQTYQRGIRRGPQRPGQETMSVFSIKRTVWDPGFHQVHIPRWRGGFQMLHGRLENFIRNTCKIGASLTNKRHLKVSTIMEFLQLCR